ncbi:hypothetical protein GE09DRAFT_150618 [Coniochaeta sp. 2T2.1]|nr:hypothetical protein GE09DRAFT_150618 [Coniochaeta sp. 2T2.1]
MRYVRLLYFLFCVKLPFRAELLSVSSDRIHLRSTACVRSGLRPGVLRRFEIFLPRLRSSTVIFKRLVPLPNHLRQSPVAGAHHTLYFIPPTDFKP